MQPTARRPRAVLVLVALPLALAAVGAAIWWLAPPDASAVAVSERPGAQVLSAGGPEDGVRSDRTGPVQPRPVADAHMPDLHVPPDAPDGDPDDIATWIRPGDPEPTAGELIEALHAMGIREGLGAFNPPGTRPLLEGLAVPDDVDLPEGYVRHYQTTDDGQPVEPILMFSPDYDFFDSLGRPLEIPEDRVVPPDMAPPGLPLRPVRIPPTP